MTIKVTVDRATVWSDHPDATKQHALAIAAVFSKNWLAGYSKSERIRVEIENLDYYVIRNTPN